MQLHAKFVFFLIYMDCYAILRYNDLLTWKHLYYQSTTQSFRINDTVSFSFTSEPFNYPGRPEQKCGTWGKPAFPPVICCFLNIIIALIKFH